MAQKDISSLEFKIRKMDSLLFQVGFNGCNKEVFKTILTEDIEFYDDRSGLNTSLEKELASFNDKCSKPFSVTRRLVSHTIHALGDYGALQKGTHNFYVDDKKVETAKFITIWERKDTIWIVKRAISYDHKNL
ncbi:nuclear transport factor 2 family protein [Aquimarina sp. BL5]|uniref:DUF4440 domain-containing protein n=1 Tax=Aquimarina sp. BL5 TaxID=1714860 RepID=UPI000E4AEA53|nr:DUF4440 domain-containing protein [Aquimarina sp. BL5]AXT51679.1 nuclear transport factor 2 family protein [Aquimarina sp. BL5]RKN02307.1 DUF4440 domain-containing protein [Aquimarina sp. BL5]